MTIYPSSAISGLFRPDSDRNEIVKGFKMQEIIY